MACWMYEGVLLFGVVFLAGYLFSALTQTRHALQNRHAQQLFLFVVLGIYFVWFWGKGQTLAMKTWHIRVVDATGRPLSQWRGLLRYLLCWLWFLPPLGLLAWPSLVPQHAGLSATLLLAWIVLWALLARWLPQGQFLHDVLAGTRLVHQPPSPQAEQQRKWWQL